MYCIEDVNRRLLDCHIYELDETHNTVLGLRKHSHHRFEINLILEGGRGKYQIGEESYDYKKGDVFVIGADTSHFLSVNKGDKVRNLVFHIESSLIWTGIGDNTNRLYFRCFFRCKQ